MKSPIFGLYFIFSESIIRHCIESKMEMIYSEQTIRIQIEGLKWDLIRFHLFQLTNEFRTPKAQKSSKLSPNTIYHSLAFIDDK